MSAHGSRLLDLKRQAMDRPGVRWPLAALATLTDGTSVVFQR